MEYWRPCPDFPAYEVSSIGRVRRILASRFQPLRPAHVLRPGMRREGYKIVGLRRDGTTNTKTIHRLMARAFLGEPPPGFPIVNHIDGIKTNNVVENLEWSNKRLNALHAIAMGKWRPNPRKGVAHGMAKLTEDQARQALASTEIARIVAKRFGVSTATISMLRSGHTWRHLDTADH